MRTTLDLDADIIDAAKSLARQSQTTAGRIISDTMRRAIQMGLAHGGGLTKAATPAQAVYGFTPFAAGQALVTNDMVRALRDESGD